MKPRSRRQLWGVLALLALIVALFAIFVDLRAVARQLAQSDLRWMAAASVMLIAGLAAYASRWHTLLAKKAGWLPTFNAANAGHMLNIFIPFRGGEAARIVMLSRTSEVSLTEVTSSFVVERLFEQVMRLSALGLAVTFGAGLTVSPVSVGGAVAVIVALFGWLFWIVRHRGQVIARWPTRIARLPRVTEARARTQLEGMLAGLSSVASGRRLALALLWSLVAWAFFGVFHLFTLNALGAGLSRPDTFAMAFGSLALAPPSAPSQPGLYNASIAAPLSVVGFDSTLLTSYTVLLQALQIIWMSGLALGGLAQSGASARELVARPAPEME
ncbi:MAG: lysylphosphatidylglycerol synthase transmembrane domain-containing protein [Anaerolineales bacterium]